MLLSTTLLASVPGNAISHESLTVAPRLSFASHTGFGYSLNFQFVLAWQGIYSNNQCEDRHLIEAYRLTPHALMTPMAYSYCVLRKNACVVGSLV